MKRTFALVLAAMMLMAVLLSGCGDNSGSSVASGAGGVTTGDAANTDPDSPYANLDLSQAENIITYVVGSEPNAIAEVIELVNEKTKAARGPLSAPPRFFLLCGRPPSSTLFPSTTLFRSEKATAWCSW